MKTELVGKQIRIRPLKPGDVEGIYAHIRNREIKQNTLIPWPYTKENARQFVSRSQTAWLKGTYYNFALELLEKDGMIGGLGFAAVSTSHRKAEVGYWLGARFRRRGIMTEAVRLALEFGFNELNLNRIYAYVFTHNAESGILLEKCGFQLEGVVRSSIKSRGRYHDEKLYAILKKDWVGPA